MKADALLWYLLNAILILVGALLYQTTWLASFVGAELNAGVAAGLIATGICGLVTYVATLRNEQRFRVLERISAAGLQDIFRSRSVTIREEYAKRIASSKNIDIMGFGLSAFREDYHAQFTDMAKTKRVRILISNPDYPNAKFNYCLQRDREEGNSDGQIASDVNAFITATAEVRMEHPDTFKVRRLRALPSINIFRMDKDILWGPYLVRDQSRNMPTFLVNSEGYLFDTIVQHFESIWDSDELSEPV